MSQWWRLGIVLMELQKKLSVRQKNQPDSLNVFMHFFLPGMFLWECKTIDLSTYISIFDVGCLFSLVEACFRRMVAQFLCVNRCVFCIRQAKKGVLSRTKVRAELPLVLPYAPADEQFCFFFLYCAAVLSSRCPVFIR